jgi:protein-S-isoprenylcysteine O-methyltransferase Ste14
MLWFYEWFFPAVWVIFLLYWQIKAVNTKSTQRLEPTSSRLFRVFIFLIAIVLLMTTRIPLPWLYLQLWPTGLWPFWLGAIIMIVGLLFAVWARQHLGSNWSRSVTIKQGHELITTGPYAVVRHPIYTGILAGFLGSAIAISQVRGIVVFVLIFLALWMKFRMEEKWMRTEFGETYATMLDTPQPWCPTSSNDRMRGNGGSSSLQAAEMRSKIHGLQARALQAARSPSSHPRYSCVRPPCLLKVVKYVSPHALRGNHPWTISHLQPSSFATPIPAKCWCATCASPSIPTCAVG